MPDRILVGLLIALMAVRADSAEPVAVDIKPYAFDCFTASLVARDVVPAPYGWTGVKYSADSGRAGSGISRALSPGCTGSDSGTVWVATDGGLLEYAADGALVRKYTRREGLGGNNLRELAFGPDGALWIASTRGAAAFSKGEFRNYTTDDGLNDNCVNSLAVAGGEVFAGTLRGVNRFDGRRFLPMDDTHEFCRRPVVAMHTAADGTLWIARNNSLSHFLSNGRWQIFQKDILRAGKKSNTGSNSMLGIATDDKNRPWLGTKMGLSVFDGDSWTRIVYRERFADANGLRDNRIQALAIDRDGFAWIGHGDSKDFDSPLGVTYFKSNEWHHLTVADGLPSDRVYRINVDRDNVKWMATAEGGLKWTGGKPVCFRTGGELPGSHVTGIRWISTGVVTVVTPAGVATFEKGKPVSAPVTALVPLSGVSELNAIDVEGIEEYGPVVSARDAQDRAWIGTMSEGLFMRDKDGWHRVMLNGKLFPDGITALCFESDAVLWVGTASEGAIRLLVPAAQERSER